MTQNSPTDSDSLTSSYIVLSRQRTGKKMRRDRPKAVRDNKKLLKKVTVLTQQSNKWRQRCWRM